MIEKLKNSSLFKDINENQLEPLLKCLKAVKRQYRKNEFIFTAGDKAAAIGIVLSGGVRILQDDFWGYRTILAHVGQGGLFGEALSCAGKNVLPVSVVASELSEIMMLDYRRIVTTCSSACGFHTTLIMNMMRILADKNIMLTQKLEHLSKRNTRDKLISFLSAQAMLQKNTTIELPFNRQELADYLCVERSAMSRELGAMLTEGLIKFKKNKFELILEDKNK